MVKFTTLKLMNKSPVPVNFQVFLTVMHKNSKQAIEIRRNTVEPEAIKAIITAAFKNEPIVVFPTFRNRLRATATLMANKILKFDHDSQTWEFLI